MKSVAAKLISDTRFSILGKEFLDAFLVSLEDEKTFEKWPFTDELDFAVAFEEDLDKQAIEKVYVFGVQQEAIDALKIIRPFMEEGIIKTVLDAKHPDTETFYTAINDAEWSDYSDLEDEAITAYVVEHPEDAKLSTAQRKRLPSSSFCGPNRAFPVPDCTHVDAARRLIGRASVSAGTKKKILSCVSRKASAMGCDAKAKEQAEKEAAAAEAAKITSVPPTQDNKKEDCACKDADAKIVQLTADNVKLVADNAKLIDSEKVLTDKLTIVDALIIKLQKDLDLTREEFVAVQNDLTQMADQLFEVQTASTNYLVDNVIVYKLLSGEVIEDQKKTKDELIALGESVIKDKLTEITGKVDIKKITDSINSGLTNNPNKLVIDPTTNIVKKVYDKDIISQIEAEHVRIQLGGNSAYGRGQDAAKRFIYDMQVKGLLPTG